MEPDSTLDYLINKLKRINFKDETIKTEFFEKNIDYKFKTSWGVFDNVCWKDIIKYSLGSEYYQHYQLGKLFKSSTNGIYDFIDGGFSFYELPYREDINYLKSETGYGI